MSAIDPMVFERGPVLWRKLQSASAVRARDCVDGSDQVSLALRHRPRHCFHRCFLSGYVDTR